MITKDVEHPFDHHPILNDMPRVTVEKRILGKIYYVFQQVVLVATFNLFEDGVFIIK